MQRTQFTIRSEKNRCQRKKQHAYNNYNALTATIKRKALSVKDRREYFLHICFCTVQQINWNFHALPYVLTYVKDCTIVLYNNGDCSAIDIKQRRLNDLKKARQGVIKRCRLSWLTNSALMSPNEGIGGE
jgi:hypothetical protein